MASVELGRTPLETIRNIPQNIRETRPHILLSVPALAKNFPQGMAVSENGKPQISKDGGRLFFGIPAAPKPEPKDAPEPVKVDIWNWKDPYLQPMQKVQAEEDKKRTLMCVVHFLPKEKKFVQLATAEVPEITLSEDAKLALDIF